MESFYAYNTPIGTIGIFANENAVIHVEFNFEKNDIEMQETPLIKKAYTQIMEYLEGKRKTFDIPLEPKGTVFQKKVWDSLTRIPYGETRSYKEIAISVGNDKAARAVGMANNKNPLPLFIPCHRVIGANGSLVGFGGGLDIKEKLLQLEKQN